jgi:arylformamidase
MRVIDISWPISENITQWRDTKSVTFRATRTFSKDKARNSIITFGTHTGTHVDAPAHFLRKGKTIDKVELTQLYGACRVLNLTKVKKITKDDLVKYKIMKGEIILCKTVNSKKSPNAKFNENFVYLDTSGAQYLASKKIKAFGIDYLGVEHSQQNHPTHTALLSKNIPIVEGLRLKHVMPGSYMFMCLPLHIIGLEAAPARAVLIK